MKRGYIKIDKELCKGCYLCIEVCPKELIEVSNEINSKGYTPAFYVEEELSIEEHKCTGCTLCAINCPDVAIEVYRE